jgi:hypothetical protein
MKKGYIILMFISLTLIFTFSQNGIIRSNLIFNERAKTSDSAFIIMRIDSTKHIYQIYAARHDSTFKIVSKKDYMVNCKKIEVGKSYKLEIVSWFLPEEFHPKMRMDGVKINGEMIKIERDSVISDLFLTKNLKGLCYFPNSQKLDILR